MEEEILTVAGTVITLCITAATWLLKRYTGIQIEARHREALHSAIQSAVEAHVKHGAPAGRQALRAQVLNHLQSSVPDALKKLTPGTGVLDTLVERYYLEAVNRFERRTANSPMLGEKR